MREPYFYLNKMGQGLAIKLVNTAKFAQAASRKLAILPPDAKNAVLKDMAYALLAGKDNILKANKKDISACKGKNKAFIDRLSLTEAVIKQMSDSLLDVAGLKDPVAEVMRAWDVPSGLKIKKVRTPIGVIAIIYESRPNVTSDCIGLCFKAGNSVILRGGSESLNSNLAIFSILNSVVLGAGLPKGTINLIDTPDRKAVDILLKLNNYIDRSEERRVGKECRL